jgi:hypothetical protein
MLSVPAACYVLHVLDQLPLRQSMRHGFQTYGKRSSSQTKP